MKIRVTLELEFADLPEDELAELKAGLDDEDEPLPVLADYSEAELRDEAADALTTFFDGDYSNQAELWAGSNFYVWVKSASVVPDPSPEPPKDNVAAADLRERIFAAIYDPGTTEGYKGNRTVTEWKTDAVMRALSSTTEGSDRG